MDPGRPRRVFAATASELEVAAAGSDRVLRGGVKVALLVFQWGIYKNRSFLHRLFIPFEPERLPGGNQLHLEFGRGSMSAF